MNAAVLSPAPRVADEVLAHLLARLAQVQPQDEPFPHFFVEDIFPQAVYQALLAAPPALDFMEPVAEKHFNPDGTCNRYELRLHPSVLAALPSEQCALWQSVYQALASPQLQQAVFATLSSGLMVRYGVARDQVSQLPGHPRTALMRETRGYSIAPHPDGRRKVVTMQFALPADRSQEDLGTTFYERSLDPRDWLSVPRGFRRARQMPFRPNCAYGFVVLNGVGKKSWHGRETLAAEQGTRNSILHIYYADKTDAAGKYAA